MLSLGHWEEFHPSFSPGQKTELRSGLRKRWHTLPGCRMKGAGGPLRGQKAVLPFVGDKYSPNRTGRKRCAAINLGMHVSCDMMTNSFGQLPRRHTAGSNGIFIFSFLRKQSIGPSAEEQIKKI